MLNILFGFPTTSENLFESVVIYYFAGLIIGRLGSLFIPMLLMKTRFVVYAPRKDYIRAVLSDAKIAVLSEASSYYRALLACSFSLLLIWVSRLLPFNWAWHDFNWHGVVTIPLVLLFLFAFRKQNHSISSRIAVVIELDGENIEKK
jgi:hypothetical protein